MGAPPPPGNREQGSPGDAQGLPRLREPPWILLGSYVVRQQRTRAGSTTLIYIHRFLTQARPWEVVDHDDRNPLNNQRANLVVCSQSENLAKRPSPRGDGYRGVYFEKRGGRWRAQISVGGKNRYLGTFATPELAARAYDAAALPAFGRFARLNFPGETPAQLELPGLDPFALAPGAAARVDWLEIAQERRWNASRAPELGQYEGQVDNVGIEF